MWVGYILFYQKIKKSKQRSEVFYEEKGYVSRKKCIFATKFKCHIIMITEFVLSSLGSIQKFETI